MTRDEIIAMAREAGFVYWEYFPVDYQNKLERFAALVAAAEREACAQVCDAMASRCNDIRRAALEVAAENTRARSQQ